MTMSGNRMHRLGRLARLFAVVLVLVCGCRSVHLGVLVEHRPGDAPKACPVPYAATYLLQAVDDSGTEATLLQRADMQHKFQVGFIREADGQLVAYAGGRKFPLPEGRYVWQIAPETARTHRELTQTDGGKILEKAGKVLAHAAVFALVGAFMMLGAAAGAGGGNGLHIDK
jgi:hypothetical protein